MADDVKKCTVRIGGVFYQLVTKENEQYTRQIAAHADEMIYRIMEENEHLNQTMATVLSLVNVLDDLFQSKRQQQTLEKRLQESENRACVDQKELEKAREQYWELKKEMLELTELNRDYQTLINKLTKPAQDQEETDQEEPDQVSPEPYPEDQEDLPDLIELALAEMAVEEEERTRPRQTELDDYLAAFGQLEEPQEKQQSDE